MDSAAMEYKGRVDAVFFTIRQDETDAVIERLGTMQSVQGRLRYHVARIRGSAHELIVAIHRIREQGTSSAQQAATAAIEDLDPRILVLVGIAGAVPADEFSLGDVVVATRVTDLRVQALIPEHRHELSVRSDRGHSGLVDRLTNLSDIEGWSSPESIRVPQPDLAMTEDSFSEKGDWAEKVRKSLIANFGDGRRPPRHVTAEIGSQDALVKDPGVLRSWFQAVRKIEAVEMEAAGVMEAAARTDGLYPVLVVRGVSDIVGYKRSAAWTTYACNTAAAFALALLTSGQLDGLGPFRSSRFDSQLIRILISYEHTLEQEPRILELARRLRSDGIDARIDRYAEPPLEGWSVWWKRELQAARWLVLVWTKEYRNRFDQGREGVADDNSDWEMRFLREELLSNKDKRLVVSVVFSAEDSCYIPNEFAILGWYALDADYAALQRHLSGKTASPMVASSALGSAASSVAPIPSDDFTIGDQAAHLPALHVQSLGIRIDKASATASIRKSISKTKKRVLIVAVNRRDLSPLALGREVREIAAALRGSSLRRFEVQVLWAATERDVRHAVLNVKPHILHFCCHGSAAGPILEQTDRDSQLEAESLRTWLKVALEGHGLEIAVLNFCNSDTMLDTLAVTAPIVVGPIHSIADRDAITFSSAFYMTLAAGGTGSFSYHIGQSAVEMDTDRSEQYGIRCSKEAELPVFDVTIRRRRRVLAFFASEPQGTNRLRLDQELRHILDVLPVDAFLVEQRWATRAQDFLRTLLDTCPSIVHISGHGRNDGSFVFERDHGEYAIAPAHSIVRVLTAFRQHVECAVLMFIGSVHVARHLDDVLTCVVSIDGALSDDECARFSERFYQMLGHGRSYQTAFNAGLTTLPELYKERIRLHGRCSNPGTTRDLDNVSG